MNYIKRLETELAEAKAETQAFRDRDQNIIAYLNSPKFRSGDSLDGYVNVVDILNLLRMV